MIIPKPKDYYVIEMHDAVSSEARTWLNSQYGSSDDGRWFIRGHKIFFLNEGDHLLFVVRWS